MKKPFLIVCFLNLIFAFSHAQVYKGQLELSRVPVPALHYQQEYNFDTTLNPGAWTKQQSGLHVSFATTDELFFRSEVPELEKESLTWEGTAW